MVEKTAFDAAKNEPSEVCLLTVIMIFYSYHHQSVLSSVVLFLCLLLLLFPVFVFASIVIIPVLPGLPGGLFLLDRREHDATPAGPLCHRVLRGAVRFAGQGR